MNCCPQGMAQIVTVMAGKDGSVVIIDFRKILYLGRIEFEVDGMPVVLEQKTTLQIPED